MAGQDQKLEQLKQKYQPVLNVIQQSGVRLSHVHVQDNKLFIQGEAPSDQIKNKVWDEIKRVDPSYSDLTCDLTVNPSLAPQSSGAAHQAGASAAGGMQTYTVKPGDSLRKSASSLRQRRPVHENLRGESGSAKRSGPDQSRSDPENPVVSTTCAEDPEPASHLRRDHIRFAVIPGPHRIGLVISDEVARGLIQVKRARGPVAIFARWQNAAARAPIAISACSCL